MGELDPTYLEVDPLTCACGAQMRVISFIFDPAVIHKILTHLSETGQEQHGDRQSTSPTGVGRPDLVDHPSSASADR